MAHPVSNNVLTVNTVMLWARTSVLRAMHSVIHVKDPTEMSVRHALHLFFCKTLTVSVTATQPTPTLTATQL